MLEGLPPNNAAHRMTLVTDERRARAVADLIVESFEPAQAASTAFETDDAWPDGGKAWLVEAYFGFAPDEDDVRALIAVASDETTATAAAFGLTEKRDWVANALAGLAPVRAGRFLVHGAHDRAKVGPNDIGIEIEAGLAFGTGHHGTTRGCLLHFDRLLKRRRPQAALDVGCGAGVLAIAAARALRRKVWLGDIDPVAVAVANANARLNGVGEFCKAVVSRGVENLGLRAGAPTISSSPTFLRSRYVCSRPRSPPCSRQTATPSSRASSSQTFRPCSRPGGRRISFSPTASTSKAGRASG